MSEETIQLCPVGGCGWMNEVLEDDEDTVFLASRKTLEHMLATHPSLTAREWRDLSVVRVRFDDLVVSNASAS